MIKIDNKSRCSGCTACAAVCTHDAITMQADTLGFLYPHVDTNKCIECGLCNKVCAFNEEYDKSLNLNNPIVYGVRHKDSNEVATSQSGAAFVAISDYILKNGGIVYGAGYAEHFRVVHKRVTNKEECNELKGSKYVQSDLTGIFRQVKQDLRNGYTVLFTGTPCQTAGLHSFIGKKLRENLLLVDIICHGVPAPYIWRDYLKYLENKHNSRILDVCFRDKRMFGWKSHRESIKFENSQERYSATTYTYVFYKHIMLRHSCGECKYTNLQRPSDITIADFWGYENIVPEITDNKGLSLMLCNTKKGTMLFNNIKDDMTIFPAEISHCRQPNLSKPTKMHPKRMKFESYYKKHGFESAMKRYGKLGWRYQVETLYIKMRTFFGNILRSMGLR